jgi:dCTP deaminase
MGILADWQIQHEKIVEPFVDLRGEGKRIPGVITFGVGSYGYDLRVGYQFKVFNPLKAAGKVIDPKNFDAAILDDVDLKHTGCDHIVIPANSFALGYTLEHVSIPRSCLGVVLGKSSYARCSLIVNTTPIEPMWKGHITMELSNTSPIPIKIYGGEGIAQLLILRADDTNHLCELSYADKNGRYQDQKAEVTLPCGQGDKPQGV